MSTTHNPAQAPDEEHGDQTDVRPRLRLVESAAQTSSPASAPAYADLPDEAGTTTAEYTVVTGAAVAFGALLFKLLTSEWGNKILSTAFKQVIALLGF